MKTTRELSHDLTRLARDIASVSGDLHKLAQEVTDLNSAVDDLEKLAQQVDALDPAVGCGTETPRHHRILILARPEVDGGVQARCRDCDWAPAYIGAVTIGQLQDEHDRQCGLKW